MANLGQTFNAAEISVSQNYEPLPAGWYTAVIHQAELKETAGVGIVTGKQIGRAHV